MKKVYPSSERSPFLLFFSFCLTMVASLGLLSSCSDVTPEPYKERTVSEIYEEAYDALHKDEPLKAGKLFEEVERQHPYSSYAPKAEILAAYSYYMAQKYDEAANLLEAFIQLHPSHKSVPYAYYLLSLCYYEQISSVERDQGMTLMALQSFSELVKRFPDSSYSKDARLKIDLIRDYLAGHEMEIGRFYLNKDEPIASLNRFERVVQKYQTTTHAAEALYRLVEAYLILGLKTEAKKMGAILGHNYPQSIWYQDAYSLLTSQESTPLSPQDA